MQRFSGCAVRLISDRVLVQVAPRPATTRGVIYAEAMPIPQVMGRVVAIGPRCRSVAPGDVVQIDPEAVTEDVTGYDGLRTPHVIVRDGELMVHLEAR